MKYLIPLLALCIFCFQINSMFISSYDENSNFINNTKFSPRQKDFRDLFIRNKEPAIHDKINPIDEDKKIKKSISKSENSEDCSEFLLICFFKCSLAFLAGILVSDMKFIKFGVI